jgi:hypothetical protein
LTINGAVNRKGKIRAKSMVAASTAVGVAGKADHAWQYGGNGE